MVTDSQKQIAVILLQFGGPDSLDAVEPFLYNLFSDPDIFELPFGPRFQRFIPKQISSRRAPSVREKYAQIGGKSPIVEKTEQQYKALQHWFDRHHPELNVTVRLAGRYWKPFTKETMKGLARDNIRDII